MKAMIYEQYGPADVVRMGELDQPVAGRGEVLVQVEASTVTTADWRLRAAAFPGVLAIPGRLMFGVFAPRRKVLGHEFAGTVVAVGEGVSRFRTGDRVFGFANMGAHAEYLTIAETAAIAPLPEGLTAAEAAALPFGGLTALVFLRDFLKVRPGQKVAVIGASGGVGIYAVQIAKALGAEVTGVASAANAALVRSLGADHVVDYRARDITAGAQRFDVVLDTVGATTFRRVRRILTPKGIFAPLNFGVREIVQGLWTALRGGPRVITQVNGDNGSDLATLAGLVAEGKLRPVIQARFPMGRVAEAYALVEGRHRSGAVVLDVAAPRPAAIGAPGEIPPARRAV